MRLLPYENVNYETKLSLEEIQERMLAEIESEKLFRFFTEEQKKFEGRFYGNHFRIRPIAESRKVLPVIKGTIYDQGDRRIVNVKMRPHSLVIIFSCIWYGLLIKITIPFVEKLITQGEYNPITPVILLFYLFAYGLIMIGFIPEAEKALNYFEEIFERENSII